MMTASITLLCVLFLSPSKSAVSGAIPALISEPKANSNEETDNIEFKRLTLIYPGVRVP